MTVGQDVIKGVLKLEGFMEGRCFTSWKEFIAAIPSMFSVELPSNISNVNVGSESPSDSEKDHLWVKTDATNSFVSLNLFAAGAWQQVYPAPNELFFVYGDSRSVPPGYTLASDSPNISAPELANMQKIWNVGGTGPTWYSTFHMVYTGF